MSSARSATVLEASSASIVAERSSPLKSASSPNMSPDRSSVSAIVRPSPCVFVALNDPVRTTWQVSPGSPSRNTTSPAW